jgi:hypothetical protein
MFMKKQNKSNDEFGSIALKTSVEKLFKKDWFDICTFDQIADLMGVNTDKRVYSQLRAFHCVHYSDMDNRTKELLQEKVIECLRGDVVLNPARVYNAIADEGNDFAFTEDRYIDGNSQKRLN